MMDLSGIKQSRNYIGYFSNLEDINQVAAETKAICYCEEDDSLYLRQNDTWEKMLMTDIQTQGIELSLYELNRSIISQMGVLSEDDVQDKKLIIGDFHKEWKNNFYMLYGKEMSYITMLITGQKDSLETLSDGVISCLSNIGDIYSIENHEDSGIEIWVKYKEQVTCLYLFPYDSGVVLVGE